jgi:hypothetical protein
MPTFPLTNHHLAEQYGPMFAAWKGCVSPLCHRIAVSSCPHSGHGLWWLVEAPDQAAAAARPR